jgi:hypothetical protein
MATTKYTQALARGKLIPTAIQIAGASTSAQQGFLSVFSRARVPTLAARETTAREKRFYGFYNATKKEEVKTNATLVCNIIDPMLAGPSADYFTADGTPT